MVEWGTPPVSPTGSATGIYVVSLTDRLDTTGEALANAPISTSAVEELLAVRPELRMDGARPTVEQLVGRLSGFWFPDEVVVYIGLAGPRKQHPAAGEVAKRVGEYYNTPLGANGPHAGGWPLKTLACLRDLHVHYAYCHSVERGESACIGHFAQNVSEETRKALYDSERVMPFANLEYPRGNSKAHGIRGARAPKAKSGTKPVTAPMLG